MNGGQFPVPSVLDFGLEGLHVAHSFPFLSEHEEQDPGLGDLWLCVPPEITSCGHFSVLPAMKT